MKTVAPNHYSFVVDAKRKIHIRNPSISPPRIPMTSLYVGERRIDDGLPQLDSTARDLLVIGTSILSADRLALRKTRGSRDWTRELMWPRKIELEIAIELPDVWATHRESLQTLLSFLTDDIWSVTFTSAPPRQSQMDLFSSPPKEDAEVALFSGGLDSTAGMYVRSRQTKRELIAVSAYGDPKRLNTQTKALTLLKELGVSVRSVAMVHQLKGADKTEVTQRSRALAYIFLGAAVAHSCKLRCVTSYEAGPGALNLPMNDAQVASQNTRATHPEMWRQCEQLLQSVMRRRDLRLELPFLLETKGEVCSHVGDADLMKLAQASCSCDEGESHKPGLLHCGFCTSCLLRRTALFTALGACDPTEYRALPSKRHGCYDYQAYRFQARTLLEASRDFQELLFLDPLLRHVVSYLETRGMDEHEAKQQICSLLARHATEALDWLATGNPSLEVSP